MILYLSSCVPCLLSQVASNLIVYICVFCLLRIQRFQRLYCTSIVHRNFRYLYHGKPSDLLLLLFCCPFQASHQIQVFIFNVPIICFKEDIKVSVSRKTDRSVAVVVSNPVVHSRLATKYWYPSLTNPKVNNQQLSLKKKTFGKEDGSIV